MNDATRLEGRLRHDLAAIAASVDAAVPAKPRRRRRRLLLAGVAVAVPAALAAGAIVRSGPEYVDRIPPGTIVAEGEVDGSRYLLVETRRGPYPGCDQAPGGVEIVEEVDNIIGREWNTVGMQYGVPVGDCGLVDQSTWLSDPTKYDEGGVQVGESMLWHWAVHPSVTAVRVLTPAGPVDVPVHTVDGAGYAVYEIPDGLAELTVELIAGETAVPGSGTTRPAPTLE